MGCIVMHPSAYRWGRRGKGCSKALVVSMKVGLVSRVCALVSGLGPSLFGPFLCLDCRAGS